MKIKRQLKKCVPRLGVKFIGLPNSWVNRALKPSIIGLKQISNLHRKLYEKDGAKLKQAENSQRSRTVIKYSEPTSHLPSRNIKLDSTKNVQTEENRSPEKHQIFHMPTLNWDQKEKPVRFPVKPLMPRFIKPVIKKKKIKKKKPLLSLEERLMKPCLRIGFWWKGVMTSSENVLKNRPEKRKLVDYSGIYNIQQEDSSISDLVLNSEDSWLRPNPAVVLPAHSVLSAVKPEILIQPNPQNGSYSPDIQDGFFSADRSCSPNIQDGSFSLNRHFSSNIPDRSFTPDSSCSTDIHDRSFSPETKDCSFYFSSPEKQDYFSSPNKQDRSSSPDIQDRSSLPDKQERSLAPNKQDCSSSPDKQDRSYSPDKQDRSSLHNKQDHLFSPDKKNRSSPLNTPDHSLSPDYSLLLSTSDNSYPFDVPDQVFLF